MSLARHYKRRIRIFNEAPKQPAASSSKPPFVKRLSRIEIEERRVSVSTLMKYTTAAINVKNYYGLKVSKMSTAWKMTLETMMSSAVWSPTMFVDNHIFHEGSDVRF